MDATILLEQLLNGIVSGSIYALLGAGLSLVYGTSRALNFAHGEFFMVGGFAVYLATSVLSLNPLLASIAAIVAVVGLSVFVQLLLIKPLFRRSSWELDVILTTLGVSFILQNAALRLFGDDYHTLEYTVAGSVSLAGIHISLQRLLIMAVAVLTMVAMEGMLRLTRFGWALRAVSQDPEAASIVGIPAARISALAFAVSGALAAIAAVMLSPIQSVNPWMGNPIIVKAFVVTVVGGLGRFGGAIVAGFLVGIVESLGTMATASEWREVFSFALLIVTIWVRPHGLFSKPERRF